MKWQHFVPTSWSLWFPIRSCQRFRTAFLPTTDILRCIKSAGEPAELEESLIRQLTHRLPAGHFNSLLIGPFQKVAWVSSPRANKPRQQARMNPWCLYNLVTQHHFYCNLLRTKAVSPALNRGEMIWASPFGGSRWKMYRSILKPPPYLTCNIEK